MSSRAQSRKLTSAAMVMSARYLLDTNTIVALLKLQSDVLRRITQAQESLIPSIVLGELYHGAHKSAQTAQNLARTDAIAQNNKILPCDTDTASIYGAIKANLEAQGRRIPDNDMWIAALARQHKLTLLTRDAHFDRIAPLDVEQW